jgi:transcriptional regulator with XRE-family HTH domain
MTYTEHLNQYYANYVTPFDEMMQKRNMNVYQIAKASGVTTTTLYNLKNGKTTIDKMNIGTIKKIASYMGMTVSAFMHELEQYEREFAEDASFAESWD